MMNKKALRLLILVSLPIIIVGCNGQQAPGTDCTPPPETFTEMDLVGTWRYGLDFRNDTLIIREDGTYKQITYVESQSFEYESAWMPWWVEYTDVGIPYLHLEGMRLCAWWAKIDCETGGSGQGRWIDYCQDRTVELDDEGVIIIRGVPTRFEQPPRGINLVPLGTSYEGASRYHFVEP